MRRVRRHKGAQAELDITSFMNLMIILVPVLLLNMVFSHITVLDLKLPGEAAASEDEPKENQVLELVVREAGFEVFYPKGMRLRLLPKTDEGLDYDSLRQLLQELKRQLKVEHEIDKRDIVLLLEPSVNYQTLVKVMDTVRSYKAVVVADLVDAELFPEISIGDAPQTSEFPQEDAEPAAAAEGKAS